MVTNCPITGRVYEDSTKCTCHTPLRSKLNDYMDERAAKEKRWRKDFNRPPQNTQLEAWNDYLDREVRL